MKSIRFRITAVTILAILTSIIALGGIGIFTITVESDNSSVEKMSLISEKAKHMLDDYLNSVEQSVDMAVYTGEESLDNLDKALLTGAGTLNVKQKNELDAALAAHCKEVKHAFDSIASSTHGIVTYYYCINSDLGSSEHGFFYSKLGSSKFKEQDPLISSELDPEDSEHTTWYYSPVEKGHPVWIGPYKAHFLGEVWTVSYVAPIYKGHTLIGVLGMDILFDTLTVQAKSLHVYETGFVSLLDEDGTILYHPVLPLGSKPEADNESLNLEMFRQESSEDNLIRYDVNGENRQLSFSTLTNGMKVVVAAPVSEITVSRRQLTRFILMVAVLILAVFSVVTMLFMNAVIRPLLNLTSASIKLADGDYDVELNYKRNDEVGVLTNSFRLMRDRLKIHISDLNSRAYKDAMTGVKNKGAFEISAAKLDDAIRLGDTEDRPEFAVIMLDCNGLKRVNDEYGHERGDFYLKTAASAICRTFVHSPVFRMGGDEFAVILQGSDYQHRDKLLEEFEQRKKEINDAARNPWEMVNISYGLSEFRPDHDQNVKEVTSRADELMYENKRAYYEAKGQGTMR